MAGTAMAVLEAPAKQPFLERSTCGKRLSRLLGTDGDLRPDDRAGAVGAGDDEAPVERLDAVREPAQPRALGRIGAAHAVVRDLDAGDAVVPGDGHADG